MVNTVFAGIAGNLALARGQGVRLAGGAVLGRLLDHVLEPREGNAGVEVVVVLLVAVEADVALPVLLGADAVLLLLDAVRVGAHAALVVDLAARELHLAAQDAAALALGRRLELLLVARRAVDVVQAFAQRFVQVGEVQRLDQTFVVLVVTLHLKY